MKKLYYGCEEFISDCKKLADEVKPYNPDVIVAIARGGLSLAHYLGELLNIREVYSINSIGYDAEKKLDTVKVYNTPLIEQGKRVLVVDDIADSGETLKEVIKKALSFNLILKLERLKSGLDFFGELKLIIHIFLLIFKVYNISIHSTHKNHKIPL